MCMTGHTRFRLMEKSDADFDVHLDSWNEFVFKHCLETENVGSAHLGKRKLGSYAALWLHVTLLHIPHMFLIFSLNPGSGHLVLIIWPLICDIYPVTSVLYCTPDLWHLTFFFWTPYSDMLSRTLSSDLLLLISWPLSWDLCSSIFDKPRISINTLLNLWVTADKLELIIHSSSITGLNI